MSKEIVFCLICGKDLSNIGHWGIMSLETGEEWNFCSLECKHLYEKNLEAANGD